MREDHGCSELDIYLEQNIEFLMVWELEGELSTSENCNVDLLT